MEQKERKQDKTCSSTTGWETMFWSEQWVLLCLARQVFEMMLLIKLSLNIAVANNGGSQPGAQVHLKGFFWSEYRNI